MLGGKHLLHHLTFCVALDVTSEDPDDGFKPTSGRVQVSYSEIEKDLVLC